MKSVWISRFSLNILASIKQVFWTNFKFHVPKIKFRCRKNQLKVFWITRAQFWYWFSSLKFYKILILNIFISFQVVEQEERTNVNQETNKAGEKIGQKTKVYNWNLRSFQYQFKRSTSEWNDSVRFDLIVESFSEMFCFKVKFLESIWKIHWRKILLKRHGFLAIFHLDLTYATSTVENFLSKLSYEVYCMMYLDVSYVCIL